MKLWRLYRRAHGPGLDGVGGRYAPGRWHSQGRPVVYFGETASIVVLEKLAHLNPDMLPADLMLGVFQGDLSAQSAWPMNDGPPKGWVSDIEETRRIGDDWLKSKASCVLRVPSVLIPEEHNLVFNPLHRDAAKIALRSERPFSFDDRLL